MASRTMKKSSGHLKRGKGNMYNAVGAPEEHETMDEEAGFKKGGRAHKKKHHLKHGGHAEGHEPKHRADKKSRGGPAHMKHGGQHHAEHMKHGGHHHRATGGRTPYSSGSKVAMGENGGKTETGHEGQRPEG